MYFGTAEDQMRGVKYIRKLLASPQPLIDEVIQAGLLPLIVSFLKSPSDLMQYEAAWSLTNILTCSSLHVRYVVEAGAVDSFVKLLLSSNEDVQEQSCWALANIAGELNGFRAFILEKGAMYGILNLMENAISLRLLQTAAWAVSNLCVNNPDFKSISPAVPVLVSFLDHDNLDFIYNCILSLSELSKGKERIQHIIDCKVVPPVINLLNSDKECLISPLVTIIANIALGTEKQIDCLVKYDVLHALNRHFDCKKEPLRHELYSVVANITLGNVEHIDYVIRNTHIISKILSSIGTDSERIVKQAVYTLRNISNGGNEKQVFCLNDKCVVNKLCYALSVQKSSTVLAALICLENLLKVGEQKSEAEGVYNRAALSIEECGGLDDIEQLQSHDTQIIYRKAYEIMEKYFSTEDSNPN